MFLHEPAEKTSTWLNSWGIETVAVAPFVLFVFFLFVLKADSGAVAGFFSALAFFLPLWLPVFLAVIFWVTWMHYIRYMFWFAPFQEMVLLEVQLPQEVEKSPLAMETFLVTLWNSGGETTFIQRIWHGQFRPVWSLEIASNEGRVSFYMHIRKGWRNITEARLYGQFPGAKVVEVDDYVAKVPFNLDEYDLWGGEYKKGDVEALPLKTYIDYKLDKDPKEEYRVDPISNIIELLGQVGKDEYFWMQIVVRARKKDEWYGFYLKRDEFMQPAHAEIKKIMSRAADRAQSLVAGDDVKAEERKAQAAARGLTLLTGGEKLRVEAIERSMAKLIFECGFRVLYLAKRERFNGVNNGGIIRFFDSFRAMDSSREYNFLGATRGIPMFDYPWQDFMGIRRALIKKQLFSHYKNRAYFSVPYDQKPVFLSSEELATLWHFPGSGVKTPGLTRVPSARSEAPPNLPTASS